jgi:hypothetical protein
MQHNGFLAAGPGDGSRASEGFEPAGVGEASTIVADLSQYPGAGQVPQTGKAGDDLGGRVSLEMGDRLLGNGAYGVELAQQRRQLDTDRVFDHWWLVQVGVGEHLAQPGDVTVEIASAPGPDQQPAQPERGSAGRPRRGWARPRGWCAERRASPQLGSPANATRAAG